MLLPMCLSLPVSPLPFLPLLLAPASSLPAHCYRTPECAAIGPLTQYKQEVPAASRGQAGGRNEPSHG